MSGGAGKKQWKDIYCKAPDENCVAGSFLLVIAGVVDQLLPKRSQWLREEQDATSHDSIITSVFFVYLKSVWSDAVCLDVLVAKTHKALWPLVRVSSLIQEVVWKELKTNHQVKHLSWDESSPWMLSYLFQLHVVIKGTVGETLMCPTVTVSTEIHWFLKGSDDGHTLLNVTRISQ